MERPTFDVTGLSEEAIAEIQERAQRCRAAILTMTTLAASGHPGGSMSSLEVYLTLFGSARLRPSEPHWPDRDRIVVSHGHTSPGVYSALAVNGFFDLDDAVAHFRQTGSLFEGHVERSVPGVEWSSGNLGQGLSAGVGMALAARLTGRGWHTFVAMSDGEQNKGQVAEARRLAAKYRLCDLTVVVDVNRIQISGLTDDVMPVDIASDYASDGWGVLEVDGHDVGALHTAIAKAVADGGRPCVVLAHTVIGRGVSFMEGLAEFHGRGLTSDEYARAMAEIGADALWLERAREARSGPVLTPEVPLEVASPPLVLDEAAMGEARNYPADATSDNRSAWGAALADIARSAPDLPMAVFDCDLATSVKTDGFAAVRPDAFVQCGVGEHDTATAAGAASVSGVLSFWSDFGVFGCDEAYNQQRLNDINNAALKLVLTHCGLDVGEDGKTHQCLDYVAAFRDFFGWRVIVPADANQTDRAVRAAAAMPGNVAVCMGRSKLPVLTFADGTPALTDRFRYGEIEWLRSGSAATVLALGASAHAAVAAADSLAADGLSVSVGCVSCPLDLDDEAMDRAVTTPLLVTVEDHAVRTGLAACVAEWMTLNGRYTRLVRLGVEGYSSSGASSELLARAGLDAAGVEATLRSALAG